LILIIASIKEVKFFCKSLYFIRSHITVFAVIFLLGYVSIANTTSSYDFQTGSMMFNYLDGASGNSNERKNNIIIKNPENIESYDNTSKSYVPIVRIASADSDFIGNMSAGADEDESGSYERINEVGVEEVSYLSLVQNNSFLSPASYYDESLADLKYGIVKYKVQSGDSPGSIATSFGISTYTVLWANNLKVGDIIKPGQELEILPITGVKHKASETDTVESVAEKYKADADEIIVFNGLPADGALTAEKILIIPNGQKEAPIKPRPQRIYSKVVSSSKYSNSKNLNPNKGHRFPYGYCTWYVASRVYVPWGGHAKSWLYNSRAYGYRTGTTPVAGSIVVTTENRWYGHVAYVEAVHGDTITLSEMNYVGWGRKSVRVLSVNSRVIRGYVYVK
jgi:surface antigen